MYVEDPESAERVVDALRRRPQLLSRAELALAPSFPLLPTLALLARGRRIALGAQTLSPYAESAHTGEVSARTLKNFGVSHVIIGHSERRAQGESDEAIAAQLTRAREVGLTAVLCVGEKERDSGGAYFTTIAEQLSVVKNQKTKCIIAYEPVWAIGRSAEDAMKPLELQEMAIFIRKTLANLLGRAPALKIPILYGGSVDASSARNLLAEGGVAGLLVGRASADAHSLIDLLVALTGRQ